jgi:hypothetical protein
MRRITSIVVVVLAVAAFGLATPGLAEAEESAEPVGGSTATDPVQGATAEPLASYTFRPNDKITRAAAARMLYRIEGSPAPGAGCSGLTDVPPWAHDAICWLVNNDHASGYADKSFRPDNKITRAAAARMLHHIAGTPAPGEGCGGLTDVPEWAQDAICWLVGNGHASGYPDATFRPSDKITRAAAARMLHRIEGTPAPGSGCSGMTDVPAWARDAICWLVNNDYASGYLVVVPPPPTGQATAATMVNNSRTVRGLRALTINATLNNKAQEWSAYLARIGRLLHSNLASGVPSSWRALAENVGYGSSVESVHGAFMRSSGHYGNIVGNYTHLGTGVTTSGSRVYVVHVFMRV